ncbi:MAG: alpha/beta hydrolase [Clostridia bacterium]|nr:alpha/beta hydrolase [Clostridia bacterium]
MDKTDIVESLSKVFWNRFVQASDEKRIRSQTPDAGVTVVSDVSYIDDGAREHLFDVYYRENDPGSDPIIIDIHGGGWEYGYKEINKYYCMRLAAKGFVVYSINYRLVPEVTLAGQLQDCMTALKFIGEHLACYPGDTGEVFLTGDSAGAQIAGYCALLNKSAELRKIWGTVDTDLEFNAVALTSPVVFPNQGIYKTLLSPVFGKDIRFRPYADLINIDAALEFADLPPCCLITSSGDFMAQKQAHQLYYLLRTKNTECVIYDFPKWEGKSLPHVFAVVDPYSEPSVACIDGMLEFFRDHLNKNKE